MECDEGVSKALRLGEGRNDDQIGGSMVEKRRVTGGCKVHGETR